jgi:hypothetical protein
LIIRCIDTGAARQQFADNVEMSGKAGDAQGQPGVSVDIGFLDVGSSIEREAKGLQVAAFDRLPKVAVGKGGYGVLHCCECDENSSRSMPDYAETVC